MCGESLQYHKTAGKHREPGQTSRTNREPRANMREIIRICVKLQGLDEIFYYIYRILGKHRLSLNAFVMSASSSRGSFLRRERLEKCLPHFCPVVSAPFLSARIDGRQL